MPVVRGLQKFLSDHNLVNVSGFESLSGAVLGVDGLFFLKQTASTIVTRDPLRQAIGGHPSSLGLSVRQELTQLCASTGISRLLFVFGGLVESPNKHSSSSETAAVADPTELSRFNAWQAHAQGKARTATFEFKNTKAFASPALLQAVMHQMNQVGDNVTAFRAAYSCFGQLVHLRRCGLVHAVYGGLELLLYGATRVILNIDEKEKKVTWVDMAEILEELELADTDAFIDMCLLGGYWHCRSVPATMDSFGRFRFSTAYDLIKEHGTASEYLKTVNGAGDAGGAQENYLEAFVRTRNLITKPAYFTSASEIRNSPTPDPLPRRLVALIAKGVIMPQVLNAAASGCLVENRPLVTCMEYFEHVASLRSLQQRWIGVLAQAVPAFFNGAQTASVKLTVQSCEGVAVVLSAVPSTLVPCQENIADEADGNEDDDEALAQAIGKQAAAQAKEAAHAKAPRAVAATVDTSLATVLKGFCEASNNTPPPTTTLAKALHLCINTNYLHLTGLSPPSTSPSPLLSLAKELAKHITPVNECALLLAAHLLRTNQLHGTRLSLRNPKNGETFYEGGAAVGSQQAKEINVVARVASLLPMVVKGLAYSGPLDQDVAAFTAIAQSMHSTLKTCYDSVVVSAVLSCNHNVSASNLDELISLMNLEFEPSCERGVLVLKFLQGTDAKSLAQQFDDDETAVKQAIIDAFIFFNQVAALSDVMEASGYQGSWQEQGEPEAADKLRENWDDQRRDLQLGQKFLQAKLALLRKDLLASKTEVA